MRGSVSSVIWIYFWLNLYWIPCGKCLEYGIPFAAPLSDSNVCKKPNQCLSFATQADCVAGEYLDLNENEGCCPTCKKGLGELRPQRLQMKKSRFNSISIAAAMCGGCDELDAKCAPGLRCDTGVCLLDKGMAKWHIWPNEMKRIIQF